MLEGAVEKAVEEAVERAVVVRVIEVGLTMLENARRRVCEGHGIPC